MPLLYVYVINRCVGCPCSMFMLFKPKIPEFVLFFSLLNHIKFILTTAVVFSIVYKKANFHYFFRNKLRSLIFFCIFFSDLINR